MTSSRTTSNPQALAAYRTRTPARTSYAAQGSRTETAGGFSRPYPGGRRSSTAPRHGTQPRSVEVPRFTPRDYVGSPPPPEPRPQSVTTSERMMVPPSPNAGGTVGRGGRHPPALYMQRTRWHRQRDVPPAGPAARVPPSEGVAEACRSRILRNRERGWPSRAAACTPWQERSAATGGPPSRAEAPRSQPRPRWGVTKRGTA